jgi:nucleoside-diphosphate-sugar epimerase
VRALVAGGAGFIGSHLCARLLADGHEVVCVDNLVTGDARNLAAFGGSPAFRFVEHDLIVGTPDVGAVDAVFQLASPASPPGYMRRPVETALVNSLGTKHLLDFARQHGSRFLMASTSEAYGDPLEHPQRETYWGNVDPIGLRACYDEGKRFGEMLTSVYWRTFDVDARIIRIFNCYGPHSDPDDGRIVPTFVRQALVGEPIPVHGDGSQTRSLCYVADLVEGMVRAMFAAGTTGEVFNLGNPDERSVREFAEVINRLCGNRSEIVYLEVPERVGDPQRRCPDIMKARTVLGWEPRVPLEDGLSHTIAWFRERLGIPARGG